MHQIQEPPTTPSTQGSMAKSPPAGPSTSNHEFSSGEWSACGVAVPGVLADSLHEMARSGASILSANGSIHGNRYHISAMVQGPEEQIHTLISNRRSHPDCSTIPGPVLHHETPVLIPCLAFQLHLAAHDDAQLLAVLEDADRLNIDLAGFDIARIRIDPAHQHRDDFEIDDATHLLGAELRFEVEESQVEHLARFKALLACLRSQPDYVDISEISPRPGPWWCFRTYRR